MSLTGALIGLLLLQAKHLAADYLLQSGFMVRNKKTYGHLGGLLHAGVHVVLTGCLLLVLGVGAGPIAAIMAIEFMAHYHIDWMKETLSNRWRIGPDMVRFWHIHGIDQALHQATYVAIIWWVAG